MLKEDERKIEEALRAEYFAKGGVVTRYAYGTRAPEGHFQWPKIKERLTRLKEIAEQRQRDRANG